MPSLSINGIKLKIAKAIGILYKVRHLLNLCTLRTLYFTFVYPYLLYGIIVWGSTYSSYLDGLFKLQKRVIRIISSSSSRAHSLPIFSSLKLLTLYQLYTFQVALFMYRFSIGDMPTVFNDMFVRNEAFHNYPTRSSSHFSFPLFSSDSIRRSIRYQGVKIWNDIIININIDCSIYCFKNRVKDYLNISTTV